MKISKWQVGCSGNSANLITANALCIHPHDHQFDVIADYDSECIVLKEFDNIDDAKDYVAKLTDDLNKPELKWFRTFDGGRVNPDHIRAVEIEEYGNGYKVMAYAEQNSYHLASFEKRNDAQKYIDDLFGV